MCIYIYIYIYIYILHIYIYTSGCVFSGAMCSPTQTHCNTSSLSPHTLVA